jgi:hypothetical protein
MIGLAPETERPPGARRLSPRATAALIFALGFVVALAGDACHVASGTTHYDWSGVPTIWRSGIWFPFLPAAAVLLAAWAVERQGLPPARRRSRVDVITGAAAVLALYAITALLRGESATVSVVLTGALAIAIWSWWDPSPGALAVAAGAAIAGPLVEIGIAATGAAGYASDSDALGGVAPWLPCLYFAAGAVAARLWAALARDGEPARPSWDT